MATSWARIQRSWSPLARATLAPRKISCKFIRCEEEQFRCQRPGGPVRGSRALPAAGFHELGELTFGHRKTIGCNRGARCPLTALRACVTVSAPPVVKTDSHLASAGRKTCGSWPAGCGVYLSGDVRVNTCGQ